MAQDDRSGPDGAGPGAQPVNDQAQHISEQLPHRLPTAQTMAGRNIDEDGTLFWVDREAQRKFDQLRGAQGVGLNRAIQGEGESFTKPERAELGEDPATVWPEEPRPGPQPDPAPVDPYPGEETTEMPSIGEAIKAAEVERAGRDAEQSQVEQLRRAVENLSADANAAATQRDYARTLAVDARQQRDQYEANAKEIAGELEKVLAQLERAKARCHEMAAAIQRLPMPPAHIGDGPDERVTHAVATMNSQRQYLAEELPRLRRLAGLAPKCAQQGCDGEPGPSGVCGKVHPAPSGPIGGQGGFR